jgi:hypothetical protein
MANNQSHETARMRQEQSCYLPCSQTQFSLLPHNKAIMERLEYREAVVDRHIEIREAKHEYSQGIQPSIITAG